MKNTVLTVTLTAVILITLAGCGHIQSVQNTADTLSASVTSDTETSDDAAEETAAVIHSEITTEKETTVPQSESAADVSTQNTKQPSSASKQDIKQNPSVPPKSTESLSKPTTTVAEKPAHTTAPSVLKPSTTEKNTESIKSSEPQFDIDYWIEYAKNYAQSVGLQLERSAVDCWDNPIGANAKCRYLERDIKSRLNYYAKAEDITDVWIWAEKVADNSYEIYIGYA